jgi:insulysin
MLPFSFLFLFLSFFQTYTWSNPNDASYTLVEDKAQLPILTPSFAERKTLKLRLANGLEAYIISDPKAIQSGATLVVQTGSWSDPVEYPGLAHFLEHMLFLGTEKYPVESEYDSFIKEHNGESNAYTASDHTLYLFSINNDSFEQALDRFAFFFKKPLFNPSGVQRELNAIDQEFAKNFSSDAIREYYVNKELSQPSHPFHAFNSGNTQTLTKVSQAVLKKWYQEHYSANLMHLIIYSPLPLNVLKDLVVEDFKDIANTNRLPTQINAPIFSTPQHKQIAFVEPLRDKNGLRLLWELPPAFAHMQDKDPAKVVCYIMGHEGANSLLEELKNAGLAENLACGGYNLSSEHALISINVQLTEKGLREKDVVIEKIFSVLAALRQHGIPPYIFDEIQKIEMLRYQYQSRESPFKYLMQMGEPLIRENLQTFPEQSSILQHYDPQAIQSLLNFLTPNHVHIMIVAKPELSGVRPDRKEQWMQIPYTLLPLNQEQMQRWNEPEPISNWSLPAPNPFIPKKITLASLEAQSDLHAGIPQPLTLINDPSAKIYYAKDVTFQIPQTMWCFEIKTPLVKKNNAREMALAELFTQCLKEVLNPFSYSAKMADLDYDIERAENGITVTVRGYQDNAETLFEAILQQLKNIRPPLQLFEWLKSSLLRDYRNFTQESPVAQGFEIYQSIIYENYSTHVQKAQALEPVSYETFLDYCQHLFDQTYTVGLFYGNVEKEQAMRVYHKLQNTLSSSIYPLEAQMIQKVISLPSTQGPYMLTSTTQNPGNAVILGIESEGFSFKQRAAQQILAQAMNGPFYQTLRTQQQTGYIVYNSAEELERHLFNFFLVQSNSHDPRDLLARFELFIETFLREMQEKELTRERFDVIYGALLTTLKQPPQSLEAMGDLLKTLAFKYEGDFDWMAKRIQGYEDLTYEDFLKITTDFLDKDNRRRLALLIQGPQGHYYCPLQNIEEIRNISQYTAR